MAFFTLLTGLFFAARSHAGIDLEVRIYRFAENGYVFYTPLNTNALAPAAPLGTYFIYSPHQPTNGSWRMLELTANGFDTTGGSESVANTFNALVDQITNGLWTIMYTNSVVTNFYYFKVNAGTITSNMIPVVAVTNPADNASNVTNQPVFSWTGPAGWSGTIDVFDLWMNANNNWQYQAGASLPSSQTSWPSPVVLPDGHNYFNVTYRSNSAAFFTATTPTNTASQPIVGWATHSYLESFADVDFNVVHIINPFDAHLVARYNFENPGSPGEDSSGQGNNNNCTSSSGGSPVPDTASSDAAVGAFARRFYGDTSICFTDGGSAFPNLSNAISGSFTITAWVKTTSSVGVDDDDAYWGMPIWYADGTGANYTEPLSITGSKAAFTVHDGAGNPTTVHSTTSVNNGTYHFIAVTRNKTTGLMSLYVDGVLEDTATGTTATLMPATYFDIASGNAHYTGLVDDLRIYSTNLTAGNIATIFGTPPGTPLADALDGSGFVWTTGGDANWFTQTSETHDNVDAAQSGVIGDDRSTWIQTTVTGPGTLNFWWNVDSDDFLSYDYLEFTVDGNYENDIGGSWGWDYYTLALGAGTHTLRWTYYKDSSDAAGADAGFLDEVSFTPAALPVITFQPIDQTNYSGYAATLVANATSNPEASWQWYKVGSGAIAGATSSFYIITNSGTAAVAGSYYAVASNAGGSINTRTAVVTFVSAPLPPDWSKAFKTQLSGNFDNPRTNYGIASLVDGSGNIYSANSFTGTNYQTTNTFVSGPGRFASGLFKHTATGTPLWGQAITNNGAGNSYPQCVAKAPGDGVYMSGVFLGTNRIGTNILQTAQDVSAIYLARFDAAGNVLWIRTFGGTNSQFQSYHQLASDAAGNVTISALGNNFVNFGTTNVLLNGQRGVLAQYDANGNIRWVARPSGWIQYMTYDNARLYVVFGGSETNYIGGLTNTSDRKYTIAALTATNGQALWLRSVGSAASDGNPAGLSDDMPAISVSSSNIFLSATAWGSNATFGALSVAWSAPNGQYLARYNTNGTPELAIPFGGTNTWPWAAVADPAGNVYITGDFDGYATFGNKVIGGPRLGGIGEAFRGQTFLAKFDRNGNNLWVRQAQSETPTSFVNVRDIALASDGVWICGFVNYYGNFGTNINNRVYGPETVIGFPFGYLNYYVGGYLAKVTESSGVTGLPVTLLNPLTTGGNFQFQFLSQAGFSHHILYRTNLATGLDWRTNATVSGDGSTKTVNVPLSAFGPAQQGFIRVSTQ